MKRLLSLVGLAALLVAGCGRESVPETPRPGASALPIDVFADSSEDGSLPPARPGLADARLTLVRVAPTRAEIRATLPEPEPATPPADDAAGTHAGEGLSADDELRPPIPRGATELHLRSPRRGWLELDVRVDERGEVSDALPAGGDADSATVEAAVTAALGQRWFPATRGGRPVAVWCRQRYEVGPRR